MSTETTEAAAAAAQPDATMATQEGQETRPEAETTTTKHALREDEGPAKEGSAGNDHGGPTAPPQPPHPAHEHPRGKEARKVPFQYSNFYPPPPMNSKYATSSFVKTDQQTYAGRIAASGVNVVEAAAAAANKRRRVERNGERGAAAEGENHNDDDDDDDDDEDQDEDEDGSSATTASGPAARTIVIHPGSTHIRIGLATDVAPVVWPNVIARRAKQGQGGQQDDLSAAMQDTPDALDTTDSVDSTMTTVSTATTTSTSANTSADPLEARIALLRTDLRSIMRSMKLRGVSNARTLCTSYNNNVRPESIPQHNDLDDEWTPEAGPHVDVELGERALRLPSLSPLSEEEKQQARSSSRRTTNTASNTATPQSLRPWKLFRPLRAGRLNHAAYVAHYGASSAEQALLNDIQTIISAIISAPRDPAADTDAAGKALPGLGIPRKDYGSYSVVLVSPDLCPRSDLRALCHLLLSDMGFANLVVQQESTAAAFGAGMSSCCVVHIGGQRSSVACVDEGLLLQETRIHLDYAGQDVTHFLQQLIDRVNFAYRGSCDPRARIADALLLEDLKKQIVTLDATQIGMYEYPFLLRLPDAPTKKYEVRVYDEAILAPMVLFGLGVRVIDFDAKRGSPGGASTSTSASAAPAPAPAEEDEDEGGAERRMAVTAAMTSSVKHLLPVVVAAAPVLAVDDADGGAGGGGGAPRSEATPTPTPTPVPAPASARSTPAPAPAPAATATAGATPSKQSQSQSAPAHAHVDVPLLASQQPLDVAIFHSLLASASSAAAVSSGSSNYAPISAPAALSAVGEERIRRLASNVLVVGGSARIAGIGSAIEGRLRPHFEARAAAHGASSAKGSGAADASASAPAPAPASASALSPSVIPPPRDLDPTLLAWKGMAVLPRLESASEMWISKGEWDVLGWKAVRDKALFL